MHLVVLSTSARLGALVKERFDGKRRGLTEIIAVADLAVAREMIHRLKPSALVVAAEHLDASVRNLCQSLGNSPGCVPLVVAAERASDDERIGAWDAGADHVVYPFDLDAIEWCVASLCHHREVRRAFVGRGLAVPLAGSLVTVAGRTVKLTGREAEVLRVLVQHCNTVVPRGELEHGIWGSTKSRTLDVHVARLRSKLGSVGCRIETVPHVGYRYSEPPTELTCRG